MLNILVVDDEIVIGLQLEERLSLMGYNVVGVAHSGEKAIDMAKKHHPDVILMDIVLNGGIDGIEASKIITDETDIPVIFITAHGDETYIDRAKNANAQGYILKPFHEQEIKAAIEIAINRKEKKTYIPPSKTDYGVITIDTNNAIKHVNQQIITMFQLNQSEIEGLSIYEIIPNFPTILDECDDLDDHIHDNYTAMEAVSFYGVRKNKSTFPIELYIIPYRINSEIEIDLIIHDITGRAVSEEQTKWIRRQMNFSFNYINLLKRLLPVCSGCKKIRDTEGEWWEWDHYIKRITQMNFTHTICPDCARRIYPELFPHDEE